MRACCAHPQRRWQICLLHKSFHAISWHSATSHGRTSLKSACCGLDPRPVQPGISFPVAIVRTHRTQKRATARAVLVRNVACIGSIMASHDRRQPVCPQHRRPYPGPDAMTIMTLLEFAGMDRQAYDRLGASLQAQGAPAGILFHSCGAVPNGWRIVDAWRSQEDFDHFVDETLLPAARSLGIPAPARREHSCLPCGHGGPRPAERECPASTCGRSPRHDKRSQFS